MQYKRISLIDKKEWDFALEGIRFTPSQTWTYCNAISRSSGQDTNLHVFETSSRKCLIPLSERSKEVDCLDLVSPYGFGGFSGDDELLSSPDFRDEILEVLASEGYITAYILQHPSHPLQEKVWGEFLSSSHVVYQLDLEKDIESLWAGLAKSHRYEVRKSQKNSSITFVTDKKILTAYVAELYRETLKRVGASDVYNFSNETLGLLIGSENVFLVGVKDETGIQAVSLFLNGQGVSDYFLNASSEIGRSYSRSLIWSAVLHLKDNGVVKLNLGGGVKPGDSLDDFKRRFGGVKAVGQSVKVVFNREAYDRLCLKYCSRNNVEGGYFPPYWQ